MNPTENHTINLTAHDADAAMTAGRRFFVIGDPHIGTNNIPLWRLAIEDINNQNPEAVFVLGDLTGGEPGAGTTEGLRQAVDILNSLRAPWFSIIGNHDLQAPEFNTDSQAVAAMLRQLGRTDPWFRSDFEPFSVIGLSNTSWRRNELQPNEIVLEPEQIEWFRREIELLSDRPVVVLSHAPPLGSDLLIMPELHARVGNAYLNQNHNPAQIMQLIWENPNIVLWFSGHNHLGQHYRSAISQRLAALFVHTGTAVSSRDGYRYSRVIEINKKSFRLRSFDHGMRKYDHNLDYRSGRSLQTMTEERKRVAGRRFVPFDPDTMRQGERIGAPDPGATRFCFLADAHVKETIFPAQQRVIEWCKRQIIRHDADRLVLGGDITHHPVRAQAAAFLRRLGIGNIPIEYLPGNNEGTDFDLDDPGTRNVTVARNCRPLGKQVFLMETANRKTAADAAREFFAMDTGDKPCLIFAHFPPEQMSEDATERLSARAAPAYWICGHVHTGRSYKKGSLTVHSCGGLDPVKVRRHLPELLLVDWQGYEPHIQRLRIPDVILLPPSPRQLKFGLACRHPAGELIQTAIEHRIDALQFNHRHTRGRPSKDELHLAQRYRRDLPESFLSIHLPNVTNADGRLDRAQLEPCLEWAECLGIENLTAHLPQVPAHYLFGPQNDLAQTGWAKRCLKSYAELAARAIDIGAGLSLENIYNKTRNVEAEQEILSSRPWHLTGFIDRLRLSLRQDGYPPEAVAEIGALLDFGHAFRDARVAKILGLADWIDRARDYINLAHIHQVVRTEEGPRNHRQIKTPCGPMINYRGVFDIFDESMPRLCPLLIEVRDLREALSTLHTLRKLNITRLLSKKGERNDKD